MALDPVKNFAKVTVSGVGYDDAAVSIQLSSGHGSRLPQPSDDGAFNLTWWNATDYSDPSDDPLREIVRCTARAADLITVTRAQENTSASDKNTSGKVYQMVLSSTAKTITDIETEISDVADQAVTDHIAASDPHTQYQKESEKGQASGYASLDADAKVPAAQLPDISISDTFVVASQAAMLALTAQVGDVAVRTDQNKTYILKTAGASVLANWQELLTPTDSVTSVAGKTGAVSLEKADVGLGNADNTSDVNKPVSTAQQTALDGKVSDTGDTMTGKLAITIPNEGNSNALDITQGDTTNNPIAVIISNSGSEKALKIIQNGNTSSSTSTGGSVLLDNTQNTGAGLIIYSNQANPSGRLVNIRANSTTFDEAALHVDYNGTRNAVEIVANSVTDDAVPLTITNTNWTASTIGVTSDVENHGSYKSIHSFPSVGVGASGSDAVASHISLDSQGVGTAVQGIFMTSTTVGGGTSGKLLNLRNRVQSIGDVETELLTLTGAGLMGLSSPTPGAVLDVAYANKTGVTAESILFRSKSQTLTLTDGTTITDFRQNQFLAPTINGVVGGGTETVTNAATVYIDNAPNGSNIVFTNGPYALLVNAGDSKFGGQVIGTTFRSTSGGLVNNASANNAKVDTSSNGTTISRNINDANTALIVQQQHASSTGNIIDFKSNTTVVSSINKAGVFLPVQATTASAPTYVKGGIYFDTTLNKLRVGGATGWETVTSV